MIANDRVFQVGFDIPAKIGDHINDIHTPALVIDLEAFERNVWRMADRARAMGVRLRAHAKTYKSADIALYQIKQGGACGICCQKVSEAEALIGENLASVSQFVAKIRIDRYRRDFLHSRWEPKPPLTFDQLIGVLHVAAMPRILARRRRVERSKFGITHATVNRRACTLFARHSSSCRRLCRICVRQG
jgi:hypothetical protein